MKSNAINGALALALALLSQNTYAHTASVEVEGDEVKLCEFAPKNDMQIPAGLEADGQGITEAEYTAVMDKFERIYAPIVTSLGGRLKLKRLWSNGTVNASAGHGIFIKKNWIINAYGGLARFPGMTADGEMLVMCHEMGHHIGGFPQYPGRGMSNEGQADYFGTMKCFRRVVQDEDNQLLMAKTKVPAEVAKACSKGFTSAKDIAICERAALAGEVLGNVLHSLGLQGGNGEPSAPLNFATPDKSQVAKTQDTHPHGQCRMDTYFAGAMCPVSMDIPFSSSEPIAGACAEENKAQYGFRSHCWYKPQI